MQPSRVRPLRVAALLRHPWIVHLRLPFNLQLAPIYLWGVFLAGGSPFDARFWLGFVSLHVFLYGGTTAFNSYYDRDDGPIGGLLRPPPVDAGLLPFSLAVQAVGVPLALLVGAPFTLAWLALFAVFTAYSHPAVRLKARPGTALVAIALGQGALGFALGWLAGGGAAGDLGSSQALLGMLTTAWIVTGLYVVTQAYQTRDDRARGDRTLPVLLGPRNALLFALASLAAGGTLLVVMIAVRASLLEAAALGLLFALLGGWSLRWALRFDETRVEGNFRTAMRITRTSSLALGLFLLVRLALP